MNIETVNELIASLESAGELSIREQKFLKLAKAFKQMAAENEALKSKGKELLGEACAVYSRLNKLIDPSIGDFVDGQTLHEFQFVLDVETPTTDAFLAGIKADGVEEFALMFAEEAIKDNNITTGWKARASRAASEYAELLREGADK
ncbi:Uncharacterised protein [Klebsiella pneumoniae]|uniref:hypothetical protein n=1 Tax=Klebsiella pneumoniae TaxID=573 RepID=UPI000E2DF601|nr:hypothetical protein [Klebsiella pneumoniae]SYS18323.1 Uncharacterised protein [Klebsiella pneumoniae]